MLTVADVTKAYGGRTLFEAVTTTFDPGKRYGLTGPNGSGKSTFMKILSGDLVPDSGDVNTPANSRMSVLHQDHSKFAEFRIRDVVVMGNSKLWAAMEEKEVLLQSEDFTDEIGMRLGDLEGVIAEENGYEAENNAEQLLEGLGIPSSQHEEPLSILQGGMRLRVLVAQALFGDPDILLLDEPTNHLDLDSIRWLQDFLHDFKGVLIVISHDRHFLNDVCTHTADIDYQNIITYPGSYDEMLNQKVQYRIGAEKTNSAKTKKIADLKEFIGRFGANAKKASQASSRRKELDRIKVSMTDLKRSNIQRPFIRFEPRNPSGKIVIEAEKLHKGFDDLKVLNDLSFTLTRGERLAVVGHNGVGKTTLLKCLAGVHEPDKGKLRLGHETIVGYMPQEHSEGLGEQLDKSGYEWLYQWDEKATVEEVRGLLGRMLFPSTEAEKPVSALSGGETVRLLLSKLTLIGPNVLLMDEPTNHLDLESIRALVESLEQYKGTLVFVTHDQYMLDTVATCVLELKEDGSSDYFPGGYQDFLSKTGKLKN